MATIFKSPKKAKDLATGKRVPMIGTDGKPVMLPKWRAVIIDHKGNRKTLTLSSNKQQAQKQADMLEQREREIKMGIRAVPTPQDKNGSRPIADVVGEYMAWGRAQGGRKGMPWDSEHAYKKERDLLFWCNALGLKLLGDLYGILPKVEERCRAMLDIGNSGKTVSNKVLHLRSLILWAKKRKYLTEDPLEELAKFDTTPKRIRRAMTVDELKQLLRYCAPHRRLLYEVAACSGLRENELRQLEPRHLDRENCAIHIDKEIDKARKERDQMIPKAVMARLAAFVDSGEVFTHYNRAYSQQGKREGKKTPPANPLLYVPQNSATMLKKDLEAAGIPPVTDKGYLDFHALRTAYINFVLDSGANVKTAQELARHSTPDMTMNVYGRARDEKMRQAVESVGDMLFDDKTVTKLPDYGREKNRTTTEHENLSTSTKNITPAVAGVISEKYWCGREDLNQPSGKTAHCLNGTNHCLTASHLCHFEGITDKSPTGAMPQHIESMSQDVESLSKISTEPLQNFDRTSQAILDTIRDTPGLMLLITSWPSLPTSIKAGILAMISAVGQNSGEPPSAPLAAIA